MNAFNRFIMLLIALLLIAVPVLLLLIAFGVLSADVINQYTNYRSGVGALENLSPSSIGSRLRVILGIVGLLLALIALLLLLRELTFGRRVARSALIDDSPGRETRIAARAVKDLSQGAAREVGAASPSTSLTSDDGAYLVECNIQAPRGSNYTELATRARENIRNVLEEQGVPVRDVEVTVQKRAS
jgi:hypothetical protein